MSNFSEVITPEMLISRFNECEIAISREQAEKFIALSDHMCLYNQKVNLTRITEPSEIIEKHYIDSILPFLSVKIPQNARLLDVGSGAGFPAVPLKIYRSDLNITAIDSLNKRIVYLQSVAKLLHFDNTFTCLHERAQELHANKVIKYHTFDVVTARAVASMKELCQMCLPLLNKNGTFIALKGEDDELAGTESVIEKYGCVLDGVTHYMLPHGDKRCKIIIKKNPKKST